MSVIRDIIYGAAHQGADLESLCKTCGLSPEAISDSEQYLGWEEAQQVWAVAVQHTDDPLLGLHLGEHTSPTIVGLVGHLMESSPDLKTAFENLSAFQQVVTEMFSYQIISTDHEFILEFTPFERWQLQFPDTARQAVEQAMAGSLHIIHLLSRRKIMPLRAEFVLETPQAVEEYRRIFGEIIFFRERANRLIFSLQDALIPLAGYNAALQQTFIQLLEQQKQGLNSKTSFSRQVKSEMLKEFSESPPQLKTIAESLNMSPRSLQRRLKDEGTSFQQISDEIRQELAESLLKNKAFSISEIAYQLGYAEASVFRKAFRKWSSLSPSAYRSTNR